MKVELTGPDDLGFWYLTDEDGNSFPLVESYEAHPAAATLFGWNAPEGLEDEEAVIQDAIEWLMDYIGEEINAPQEALDYFRELEEEEDDEE